MGNKLSGGALQLGDSNTAANNFVLTASAANGTMKLARGNEGATTQDILTVDPSGRVAMPNGGGSLTLGTAQNTTSGTAIDFTGIPSWVKRITLIFNGVSTNGVSNLLVQIGSGSVSASGYYSQSNSFSGAGASSYGGAQSTAGFIVFDTVAAYVLMGHMVFTLCSGNIWVSSHTIGGSDNRFGGGVSPTLSGTLDRIRLTTVNGTDTFDAGSVNILYEG